ncbi:BnaC01g32070D [Brassica napus]|uniref:BnaC01g32070D protein n=1 Tax=Brassica napus TaxID=3708 RepID=A0A078G3I3_BRANA|nr:BnaC01g32070D [Brassica napus]
MDECPGFPVFWIDKAKGKDDRLWSIITFLLAQANYYSSSTTFLNLLLVVGDISEHEEFQRAIRLLNSRRKFNVLLAQPPPQNASSSSGEELFDKDWLCSRLATGEQLINKLGIGKTFEPPLKHIPSHQVALTSHQVALPSHQVATKLSFAKPLCLSKHMAERARTCVFWDTVAYPLPAGLHSDDVLQNIEDALSERGYSGRVSITAFLDDHPSPPGFTGCYVSYLNDGAPTVVLWDTFDCPIIPDDDFTEVFLITKSALEEKGITSRIYGGVNFRAIVGDTTEYHGFPIFWIDKAKDKDDRLWSIITFLLAQANYYLKGETFLNLLLVVGDVSEHEGFQRTIRLLNSRRKFNVLLAQPPPQNASSSSGEEELFDKDWLCSRLAAGEQLINKLGIGKTFEPPLKLIPSHQVALTSHQVALPSHQVATKLSFAKPLCLSKHMAERARTCVFWDTVAYPLPAGLHSNDVLQNIEDALSERGYSGRVSVTAFLNDHPSPPGFTGCYVSYLNDGERDARHWQIALHLLAAARRTRIEPLNHMLLMGDISGHIELLRTIYLLNLRFSYNVILTQPPPENASSGEPLGKDWLCSSLSAGDKLLSQIEQKLIMSTVVQPLTPWQERYKAATTVVFWDLVDCPVPVGRTAVVASQIIRSAFEKMSYCGTVTIHAFGKVSNLDPLVSELRDVECHDENTSSGVFLEDMNPSRIRFHHTPTAHKDARREMMRDELRVWALGNDAPANVMAILRDTSDDKIFAGYLNVLRSINYNVVIAQPQNALGQLFDMEWLCARLGDRFLPRTRNLASYDRYRFR